MKKIVSLLAAALFATTFAAGCAKPTNCGDVKDEANCKAEKLADKVFCAWKDSKCAFDLQAAATKACGDNKGDKCKDTDLSKIQVNAMCKTEGQDCIAVEKTAK
jgi:hypothetical protein